MNTVDSILAASILDGSIETVDVTFKELKESLAFKCFRLNKIIFDFKNDEELSLVQAVSELEGSNDRYYGWYFVEYILSNNRIKINVVDEELSQH